MTVGALHKVAAKQLQRQLVEQCTQLCSSGKQPWVLKNSKEHDFSHHATREETSSKLDTVEIPTQLDIEDSNIKCGRHSYDQRLPRRSHANHLSEEGAAEKSADGTKHHLRDDEQLQAKVRNLRTAAGSRVGPDRG